MRRLFLDDYASVLFPPPQYSVPRAFAREVGDVPEMACRLEQCVGQQVFVAGNDVLNTVVAARRKPVHFVGGLAFAASAPRLPVTPKRFINAGDDLICYPPCQLSHAKACAQQSTRFTYSRQPTSLCRPPLINGIMLEEERGVFPFRAAGSGAAVSRRCARAQETTAGRCRDDRCFNKCSIAHSIRNSGSSIDDQRNEVRRA